MKIRRILICLLVLILIPVTPVQANLDPGSLDAGFDPGAGADSYVLAVALQTDGKVLIGGGFTQVDGIGRKYIARLNADGSLDTSFDSGSALDYLVRAIALQTDGRVLIGGDFTNVVGDAPNHIARLNADGSLDTGFDPGSGVNNDVFSVAVQDDGKVLIGGTFTQVDGVGCNHIARLNADGSLDTGFDPGTGANNSVKAVAVQDDGKVLIGGWFTEVDGVARNRIARLNPDGSLDTGFDTSTGVNSSVLSLAIHTDGKVLIGGYFSTVDGVPRNSIARLNDDGSLDEGFDPGAGANSLVYAVAVQDDSKVLIGGLFAVVEGVVRNNIARLNADGSLDTTFDPSIEGGPVNAVAVQDENKVLIGGQFTKVDNVDRNRIARLNADGSLNTGFNTSTGPNSFVRSVAIHTDGKVLIGGYFTQVDSVVRAHITRLNANGSLNDTFNPGSGANGNVYAVAVQPDSNVLIGGEFTQVNGVARSHVARLNADGTLDTGFDTNIEANTSVTALTPQPDGKVLIGGNFTQVDGVARNFIARLKADGSLDEGFDPSAGPNSLVCAVALQPNGKVLIGGWFTQVNGVDRNYIARLNADGSLDTTFDTSTGANSAVYAVALQSDGNVLIGGNFTQVDVVARSRIARLNADGSLDTSFDTSTGADNLVLAIALQDDGKVLIGGDFIKVDNEGRNRIARLNPDGSLDTGFDSSVGANNTVRAVTIQDDGMVVIGGWFTQVNNVACNYIARLNGSTPPLFTSATPPSPVTYGGTFSHTFTANGYPLPTFQVPSWESPPGLSLESASGALTGTLTAAGTYNFTVTASNYVAPSDTQQVILVVEKADTTTTITTHTPDPSVVGGRTMIAYSMVSSAGTPTGNVTVVDGTDSCTGTVAAGRCSLTFTSAGTKALTAAFAGDSNFNSSTSIGVVHTVITPVLYLPLVVR